MKGGDLSSSFPNLAAIDFANDEQEFGCVDAKPVLSLDVNGVLSAWEEMGGLVMSDEDSGSDLLHLDLDLPCLDEKPGHIEPDWEDLPDLQLVPEHCDDFLAPYPSSEVSSTGEFATESATTASVPADTNYSVNVPDGIGGTMPFFAAPGLPPGMAPFVPIIAPLGPGRSVVMYPATMPAPGTAAAGGMNPKMMTHMFMHPFPTLVPAHMGHVVPDRTGAAQGMPMMPLPPHMMFAGQPPFMPFMMPPGNPPFIPLVQPGAAPMKPPMDISELSGRARTRAECLERYRMKRARRLHGKKIRYHLRKINADKRPRIKGRFVKKEELEEYMKVKAEDDEDDYDDDISYDSDALEA